MTALLSERTDATNETRKVGKQSGGDSACAVSGGDSVEGRVPLYKRSFQEEPDTRARPLNVTTCTPALDTGAEFDGVTGVAPSRRMIMTGMWGVSDPRRAGRGAKKGAAQFGSLTPQWLLCSAATAAPR